MKKEMVLFAFLLFMLIQLVYIVSYAGTVTVIENVPYTETVTTTEMHEVTKTEIVTEVVPVETQIETVSTGTTTNVLPQINNGQWTTTNNAQISNQTISTGTDVGGSAIAAVDLNGVQNANRGLNFKYNFSLSSDYSNEYVPYCNAGSGDCKDSFSATLSVFNNGELVQKYDNSETLTFGGTKDYSFNNFLPEGNYSNLTATYELYGADKGYCCGMYGPSFSNINMNIDYSIVNTSTVTNYVEVQKEVQVTQLVPVEVTTQISGVRQVEKTIYTPDATTPSDVTPVGTTELQTIGLTGDKSIVEPTAPVAAPKEDISATDSIENTANNAATESEMAEPKIEQNQNEETTRDVALSTTQTGYTDTQAYTTANLDSYASVKFYEEKELYKSEQLKDPYSSLFEMSQDKKMESLINLQYKY